MPIKPQGQYFTYGFKKLKSEVEKVLTNETVFGFFNDKPLIWVSNSDLLNQILKLIHELEYTCLRDNSLKTETKQKYLKYIEDCKLWLIELELWEELNNVAM